MFYNFTLIIYMKSYLGIKQVTITNIYFPVYFIRTSRGRPAILFNHIKYFLASEINNKSRWRCYQRTRGCKSAITTVDGILVKYIDNHNHE